MATRVVTDNFLDSRSCGHLRDGRQRGLHFFISPTDSAKQPPIADGRIGDDAAL